METPEARQIDRRGRKRKTPVDAIAAYAAKHSLPALAERLRPQWPNVSAAYLWQLRDGRATPSWSRGELLRAALGWTPPPLDLRDAVGVLVDTHGFAGTVALVRERLGAAGDQSAKGYVDGSYLRRIIHGETDPRWPLGNALIELAAEALAPPGKRPATNRKGQPE